MVNRGFFGLSFCRQGRITYEHNGKKFVSEPGVAVFLPKGASYIIHDDEMGEFPIVNFQCTDDAFTDEFICVPISENEEYLRDYEKLKRLFLEGNNRHALFSAFYSILGRISGEGSTGAGVLTPVMKYLTENFADPDINNADLAKKAGISEVYLRKLFAEKYKTSPRQYIIEMRIACAKQLLCETDNTVSEISSRCGFSGIYHFCRAFKAKTAMTPSEYRHLYGNALI